jgi:DNA-binding IscR family transcriptional regulator
MILLAKSRGKYLSVRDMAKGGFVLSEKAAQTNLLNVFEVVDGAVGTPGCMLGLCRCVHPPCILDRTLCEVNRLVVEQFRNISLERHFENKI